MRSPGPSRGPPHGFTGYSGASVPIRSDVQSHGVHAVGWSLRDREPGCLREVAVRPASGREPSEAHRRVADGLHGLCSFAAPLCGPLIARQKVRLCIQEWLVLFAVCCRAVVQVRKPLGASKRTSRRSSRVLGAGRPKRRPPRDFLSILWVAKQPMGTTRGYCKVSFTITK